MTLDDLKKMEINETRFAGESCLIRRVLNGWIYEYYNDAEEVTSAAFIPEMTITQEYMVPRP